MSKTAKDVVQEALKEVGNDHGWNAIVLKELDAAGFVIVSRADLQKALNDSTASDNWHKASEGYYGLRRFIANLIALPTPPAGKEGT